jgi:hypothetical protein
MSIVDAFMGLRGMMLTYTPLEADMQAISGQFAATEVLEKNKLADVIRNDTRQFGWWTSPRSLMHKLDTAQRGR